MGILEDVQNWYKRQCDGNWEHHNGITIETLDNPGWQLAIDLTGTKVAEEPFELVCRNVPQNFIDQSMGKVAPPFVAANPTSDDWLLCFARDEKFIGAGSPQNLSAILETFLNWVK